MSRPDIPDHGELEQQAGFLSTVISGVHGQIYAWDRHKRFVYANNALEQLWGLTREQYVGKTMKELGYPDAVEAQLSQQIDQVLEFGQPVTSEIEYLSPSGLLGYYTYVISPVMGADGRPELVVGVSRDISERKRLEQQLERTNERLEEKVRERTRHLRESEQRYRSLFETIDEGFCILQVHFDSTGRAVDYRFLEMNPAFEKQAGLLNAQGKTARELVPDLEERWYETYGRVARTGKTERFVEFSPRLGRWFEVDAFRMGAPSEAKVALLFRDITERKRSEEELLRVLGLLEGITRGSEDLIAALDSDYRFLYFNQAYWHEYNKLWNCEIEEGTNLLDGMAPWPQEQRKAKELWIRALNGESFRIQMEFGPSPEETRVYDLRFNPIRDPQGHLVGAAHIFRDVTEQVRIQESLRRSEERLRESDRRKDEYLAMLGHELRNPLAAVRSATEVLRHLNGADPRLRRASGVLDRQTTHMGRLIDGLLEVSRIARGKIDLNTEVLDLGELLSTVLQDRKSQFDARQIACRTSIPAEPVRVSGDAVRLAQIFDNLLGNALKSTHPDGCVSVEMEAGTDWARVRVSDTGVGVRGEMLDRIFEPFYQEKQDIARAAGGLGLGLPLVKGLVELHGGNIKASSAGPGLGTEFEIRLPRSSAPVEPVQAEPEAALAPKRILIVEDNPDAGQALQDLLELKGHTVAVAVSAPQALDLLWRQGAEIVLCDLGLPGMSGYELAKAIRGDTDLKGIPLVALTGYGQPEDRQRTRDAGFDAHLTKPVDIAALDKTLRWLGPA
ncbi:PAS domain-containing protein [Proteobacteria bacterium 005FR1]|nr:PAS domain-containing protein [Proteobacteria bacterium 005FR1]